MHTRSLPRVFAHGVPTAAVWAPNESLAVLIEKAHDVRPAGIHLEALDLNLHFSRGEAPLNLRPRPLRALSDIRALPARQFRVHSPFEINACSDIGTFRSLAGRSQCAPIRWDFPISDEKAVSWTRNMCIGFRAPQEAQSRSQSSASLGVVGPPREEQRSKSRLRSKPHSSPSASRT